MRFLTKQLQTRFKQRGWLDVSESEIRLFWWSDVDKKNFGDVLGPYLVERISGKSPLLVSKRCTRDYNLTIGSILKYSSKHAVVWGSGILSANQRIERPRVVHAVRGPLSRRRLLELGYECPDVYGDPALLLPRFYHPKVEKYCELGIVPHFVDFPEMAAKIPDDQNVKLINLFDPVEKVVDDIASCKRILSSSLHGLIVADAYAVPAAWGEFSDKAAGDGVKYLDYFLSVNLDPYEAYDFTDQHIDVKKICAVIDRKHHQKIRIDLDKLLKACPFAKHSP